MRVMFWCYVNLSPRQHFSQNLILCSFLP
ncbi:hypothetical protein M8C21_003303 [Ambrosia artemisiifolia]|uniref:Uncharacterized protein n=1 Tax=Ambrosia artemisiifolia TaxID=4212 RepID=A0AAD5GPW6_AMBAR|nr:hypothetical protein M8C21_003303 [Ambrosia artemisiifolia]